MMSHILKIHISIIQGIYKLLAPSSIHNYSILFLIIMKDKGPKVFKCVKTNSALDFLKNNTSSASTSEGIVFDKIQAIVF